MNTRLRSMAERQRAAGFRDLAGTHVEATVPLTQRLMDVLVAEAGSGRHLSGLKVTIRPDHEIGVAVVKPVLGFETRLSIDLRIRGPVDLASDPHLYLLVARPSLTWSAISRLVIAAGLAPPGVEVGRDGVAVDLRMLASRAGLSDLLSLVRTVSFDGEAGVIRVRVVADVPEGGIETGPGNGARADTPRNPRAVLPVETALAELRGAYVTGRIAISQALANEALGVVLDAAREHGSREAAAAAAPAGSGAPGLLPDASTLAGWVQRASVRFEDGRLVVEPDLVVV